ncbi:hypothetical protein SDC9_116762 [bioreactor metagenome]|uniref:Uncharacterized protein n=1 Tax=bioreactor metagenome TaxID=1076179 RepID=A0A645C786_9ZZZZ
MVHAALQNIAQGLRVLQIRIGAAGDIHRLAPDLHGKIGQLDLITADHDAGLSLFYPGIAGDDAAQQLLCAVPDTVLGGGVHGKKHAAQHSRHQQHTDRYHL